MDREEEDDKMTIPKKKWKNELFHIGYTKKFYNLLSYTK